MTVASLYYHFVGTENKPPLAALGQMTMLLNEALGQLRDARPEPNDWQGQWMGLAQARIDAMRDDYLGEFDHNRYHPEYGSES